MPSGRTNRRALIAGLGEAFVSLLTLAASVVHAGAAEGVASRSMANRYRAFVRVCNRDRCRRKSATKRWKPKSPVVLASDPDHTRRSRLRSNTSSCRYPKSSPGADRVLLPYHTISGVAGRMIGGNWSFDGFSFDGTFRIIDRSRWGLGLTINAEPHWGLVDETSGERVDRYGADFAVAFDRELVPGRLVAALNLLYQPEALRLRTTGLWAQETIAGIGAGLMMQIFPGILIGGETRYLRKYEGIGLDNLTGEALFVGPTLFARLNGRSWMIAAWSAEVASCALLKVQAHWISRISRATRLKSSLVSNSEKGSFTRTG